MALLMLDPNTLEEMSGNENVMPEEMFRSLVEFVRVKGFKQAILVHQAGQGNDKFVIVDGVHRKRAAVELGMQKVPCWVDTNIATLADAKAVRIGMNKHRGELDLSAVGRTMLELSLDGWSPTDLTIVGYSEDEVQALLESAAGGPDPDAITANVTVTQCEPTEGKPEQTYKLEIEFSKHEDYKRVSKELKKAGGGDLAAGLLRVLDF